MVYDAPAPTDVLLLLHCTIGLVAAQLAHQQGRDLGRWLIWGMVGGTLALVMVLADSPRSP
ncbi:hypothetical protein XM38_001900 [Halomicronema hongdechloris C2206]|uniref:Uncharacterized protein n=1 Tax=Halomicronema hongdechloris C2206 TaxID=1641165 RepID=A0A1Z3HG32_9CYAN|nr:hypothetical protein [Halomicronema hongdechloris]ASC69263.1 hypothetical protein XM38_001900 [Halomicronema hongdechloris C2206]